MARRKKTTSVNIPRPAPLKSARNARTNKRLRSERDPDGKIARDMMQLCNDLGFSVTETYGTWVELALCHEFELGIPQAAAEESAWRNLKACLDKRATGAWEAS